MKPDIQVTAFKVTDPCIKDIGKEASAALPPGRRHRYYYEGTYTLADGREIPTRVRAMTKPKLEDKLATTRRHVAQGMVSYNEDCELVMVTFCARPGGTI